MGESLITDEARALIGTVESEPVRAVISPREVARFCHAVGDLNPVYFDDDAAQAAGYERAIAPPTFLAAATASSVPQEELRLDGLIRDGRQRLPLRVARTLFGGDSWEYFEPVYQGDEVTATTRLLSLEEKQGREGPFVLMQREISFQRERDGVLLARRIEKTVVR